MVATYTISAKGHHTHTVVFLHGRGSSPEEFANEFMESQASDDRFLPDIFPNFKWVFPGAQERYCERFQSNMTQWFDMWSVEEPRIKASEQKPALLESCLFIEQVIATEAQSIGSDRIILAGISQGCATALYSLLYRQDKRLAAFFGFCSWLPSPDPCATTGGPQARSPALSTPIFMAHCVDDQVVPFANGIDLKQGLTKLGMGVVWKQYDEGGHWINEPEGVDDLIAFLLAAIR